MRDRLIVPVKTHVREVKEKGRRFWQVHRVCSPPRGTFNRTKEGTWIHENVGETLPRGNRVFRASCEVIGLFDILQSESIFPRLAVQDRDRG